MAEIKDAVIDCIVTTIANLMKLPDNDKYYTPLIIGGPGVGKSEILKTIREKFINRLNISILTDVVGGSTLKEGELPGYPIPYKLENGSTELNFVPYYKIAAIKRVQEVYYKRATTKGFKLKEGTLLLDPTNEEEYILLPNGSKKILVPKQLISSDVLLAQKGDSNKYSFGEKLPYKYKKELILSGQISIYLLLLDEVNRPDGPTMKEIMDFSLNHVINGYNLPWWLSLICAGNPSGLRSEFATQPLEPAQLSRFIVIPVYASMDAWIDHELANGGSPKYVNAVALSGEESFNKYFGGETDMKSFPNPRAHSMLDFLSQDKNIDELMNFGIFDDEDKKNLVFSIQRIFSGFIGSEAANMILNNLADKESEYVAITEIFDGLSPQINEKVFTKLKKQNAITRGVLVKSIVRWLATNYVFIKELNDDKQNHENRNKYTNYISQINQFITELDSITLSSFIIESTRKNIWIRDKQGNELKGELVGVEVINMLPNNGKLIVEADQKFSDTKLE